MSDKTAPATETVTPSPTEMPAALPDKLAPFRPLFGMPVAVQFAGTTPYVQIAPIVERNGRPRTARLPNNEIIGLPSAGDQQQIAAVAIGVLRHSADGTWLIIEESIAIPEPDSGVLVAGNGGREPKAAGRALMDVYVRPEMVTHISFVKSVEMFRREDA